MAFIKSEKKDKTLTDKEMVIRFVEHGEQQWLNVLYENYCDYIYSKCLSVAEDEPKAKDLTHDIFIKIFSNLKSYKGNAHFASWVSAITNNHCISFLKKSKKFRKEEISDQQISSTDFDESENDRRLLKDIQLSHLELFFEQLKVDEKMILLMRYQDSMSVKQIAQSLEIGESAVKMRLKRSREQLVILFKNLKNTNG